MIREEKKPPSSNKKTMGYKTAVAFVTYSRALVANPNH